MPERLVTNKPTVICGTPVESGVPNTGQIQYTLGGSKTFSSFSGAVGPDVLIVAGGGRLDSVTIFAPVSAATGPAASGLAQIFYDSAVVVSGGPLSTSGHKVVAHIHPCTDMLGVSAIFNSGLGLLGKTVQVGAVFTSGLVHTTRSGQAGFTINYTPVTSN